MKIKVFSRKGKDLGTYEAKTTEDLKNAFYKQNKKYYPDRQYYTIGNDKAKVTIKPEADLAKMLAGKAPEVYFKDLGPQVGYRTVFYVEYFGPILAHALFFYFPLFFYGEESSKSWQQEWAFYMVVGHYLKREFESAFVHRFSHGTMPIKNIFKNSFHYWALGGAFIAYYLYHPQYTAIANDDLFLAMTVVFVICELGNLVSHITLRNLRPPGDRTYRNPQGGMFNFVSCANYTYELFAWLAFNVATSTITGWFFLLVSTLQIMEWANKKHRQLRKLFPNENKGRKRLFPFIW